jgi:hypothetical protein
VKETVRGREHSNIDVNRVSFPPLKFLSYLEIAPPWITMKNDQIVSSSLDQSHDSSSMKQEVNRTSEISSIQEEDPMKDYFEKKKRDEKIALDYETTLLSKNRPIRKFHDHSSPLVKESSSRTTSSSRKSRERRYSPSPSSRSRSRTPSVERSHDDDHHRHHDRRHHHHHHRHRSRSPKHVKLRDSYKD